MPARQCNCCGETEPPPKQCVACKKAWYCSKDCQRIDWVCHIFDCNPPRPITTADYLALAVRRNLIPEHPQTCEDYGFTKSADPKYSSMLLGLYIGLLDPNRLGVKPLTLHRWRLEGTMIENIKKEFQRIPEGNRGDYYAWFLDNQHIVGGERTQETEQEFQSQAEEYLLRAWRFLGKPPTTSIDEIRHYQSSIPKTQNDCFAFYAMRLSGGYPGPDLELWVNLGFCACECPEAEMQLSRQYNDLIHRCTFDEFHTAYRSSSLASLFRDKGIDIEDPYGIGITNASITDVLSETPDRNKSVWDLKQFMENKKIHGPEDTTHHPTRSVSVDYGFLNCETQEEYKLLFDLYKGFFALRSAEKPLELHRACIQGRLFEYFTQDLKFKIQQKKKYKKLLRNPYPLPQTPAAANIAGMTITRGVIYLS